MAYLPRCSGDEAVTPLRRNFVIVSPDARRTRFPIMLSGTLGDEEMLTTIADLAGDWARARAALQQQLDMLDVDAAFPQVGLNERARNTIVLHLKNAIREYDALMKEYADAHRA
jgi:hypothetical protein